MSPYEFRFLNNRGATLLLYYAHCAGDEEARRRLAIADDVDYARFEIWQGDRAVESGRGDLYLN